MRRTAVALCLTIGAVILTSSAAQAQWTYNVGPNYVNQAGTSCRASNTVTENSQIVNHLAGYVSTSQSTVGTTRLYCPLNVRNHSFYGTPGGNFDGELITNVSTVAVNAMDGHTGSKLGCFAYRLNYPTGSQSFGSTRYVCGTAGGCSSGGVSNSFSGSGRIDLSFPTPTNTLTVNFGYVCDAKTFSAIYYAEAAVTPNP